jgi:anti-sigma regulatory factor (Ser/Thr protein kinase)
MRDPEPASLQLRFQARPEASRVLRERLGIWLEGVGATADETFEVLLAVTEAFANAVEHPRDRASRSVEVEGTLDDGTVTVSVHDDGTWQHVRQRSDGGLGFLLIRQLMDTTEVSSRTDGTTVVMQRRLDGHPRDPSSRGRATATA